uniref:C3H1-type domain-containing protein n=1 Tax=Setaria digitata TaxID=48799 RepID=A0A915PLE6_9BILA
MSPDSSPVHPTTPRTMKITAEFQSVLCGEIDSDNLGALVSFCGLNTVEMPKAQENAQEIRVLGQSSLNVLMVINKNGCSTSTQPPADKSSCLTSLSKSSFRTHKGHLSNIIVIDVNKENLKAIWPYLLVSIRNASFISLDLELSGLGIQKGWLSKSLEERYSVIRQGAQTRSIISVGIATFQLISRKETNAKKRLKYRCQVFNMLTLCTIPFVVEADGLQFLSKHKFDFNRWISLGIPYDNNTERGSTMKTLWHEILCINVPITLHNGLVDLAFIYQHFYSILPETFTEFVVNISDWFLLLNGTPGLYDSKYISEYITRFNASFLEYVFRKCQRENAIEQARNRVYVSVEFDFTPAETHLKDAIDVVDCNLPGNFDANASPEPCPINDEQKNSLCKRYSNYGFCRDRECSYVHNVDILLSIEDHKQAKIRERRKRRYDYESKLNELASTNDGENEPLSSTEKELGSVVDSATLGTILDQDTAKKAPINLSQATNLRQSIAGCHRAGVDSFMTGFAVIFMQRMHLLRSGNFDPNCGNRIALSGKMVPLIIHRSDYIKSAGDHIAKWIEIERERNRRTAAEN